MGVCAPLLYWMCTSEAQKKVAKKQGISPFFSLKIFRVTKHLMSGARATGSLPLHFSRSLSFFMRSVSFSFIFSCCPFSSKKLMENELAWKKRFRGEIQMRYLEKKEQRLVNRVGCSASTRYFIYDDI